MMVTDLQCFVAATCRVRVTENVQRNLANLLAPEQASAGPSCLVT